MKTASTLCAILFILAFGLSPSFSLAQEPDSKTDSALGKLLFTNVTRVYFTGPGFPANSDGTLGALVPDENGGQMKIYENYICREFTDKAGTTIVRDLHSYDKLGKIEQRSAATVMSARHAGDANAVLPGDIAKHDEKPAERPSLFRPRPDPAFEWLAQQLQKAKDKDSRVGLVVAQQNHNGKVIDVSAERGIVHLKNLDGQNLYIVLSKIETLLLP